MLLNLCLLLTCTFLLSLTYRDWPVRRHWPDHALRLLLSAGTAAVLLHYAVEVGPYKIDLRYVPIALVTLRYGFGAGALVALPTVVWRLLESQLGGLVALVNTLTVLGASSLLRPTLDLAHANLRDLWKLPLPYLGVGLPLLFLPESRALGLVVYPGMLALHSVATVLVLGVLQARLRLLRLANDLRQQVMTDDLTGLGNRRRFDETLARLEVGDHLVLLDVDDFRQLTDTHGPEAGERALRYIGQVLHDAAPGASFRLGHEAFALLLSLPEPEARAVVARVQAQLADPGSAAPWACLTLSAGLASRLLREQPAQLVHRADEALYVAKTNGGNRLVTLDDLPRRAVPAPVPDLRPRYSLWQAQRTTVELLAQRRPLRDQDWQELLQLAVTTIGGVGCGSLNIREGVQFRICAAVGYAHELVGTPLPEASQLRWYGQGLDAWRQGVPRVLRPAEIERVWAEADAELASGPRQAFADLGQRTALRASLCLPVVVGGEVVAHLNLESTESEGVFSAGAIQDAQVFAQQIAALLQLQERWRELEQLARLHGDLNLSAGEQEIADHLARAAHDLLRTSSALLMRYDPAQDALVAAAQTGTQRAAPPRLARGEGLSWQALDSGRVIRAARLQEAPGAYLHPQGDTADQALMVVPMLSHDRQPLGVLCLLRAPWRPFHATEEALAAMLASVGTRVMERSAHLSDLRATLDAALNMLGVALEARDLETQGHTQRVRDLAARMGEALNLPDDQRLALRHGATLHDIGKLSVPDTILLKPGRLTPEERLIMEQHAPLGAELVARIPFLHPQAHEVVRHHHERWDGAGYPDRLGGEQIPLLARIFALCDVYDALTSVRPYKGAMSHEEAMTIILQGAGSQFDPQLTALFRRVVPDSETPSEGRHAVPAA
ncbi:HD domain-containing phosphohydrolase [Deinococcus aquaedulcis]|uniref:HD domain-containing phosphohydrolase n=1 Tax=Deinococcus aquaedulcis TaxID=2840455 RepID=UPI001C8332CC|nr:HD domain-containing phosphohydrolase [Deinococcus aquaedulcis]